MSRKNAIGGTLLFFIATTLFASSPLGLKTALRVERLLSSLSDETQVVENVEWHWSERGNGEAFVFLHGFAGNRNHWTRVARGLPFKVRLLIPDLPGFGDTTVDTEAPDYGVDQQLLRLVKWLDRLNLRKVHIGGHSMGGRLAFLFASRFPDRVLSLYLMCPSGITEGRTSEFHKHLKETGVNLALPEDMEQFEALNQLAFQKLPWIPPPLYRQLARDLFVRRSEHERIWQHLKKPAMSLELLTASLPPVKITTVWGKEDRLLSPSVVPILKAALPTMTVNVLEDVGHMPLVEVPTLIADSIAQHLTPQKSQ